MPLHEPRKPRMNSEESKLRDRFIKDTETLLGTNYGRFERFVATAKKYSALQKKRKDFLRASEIEELVGKLFEKKRQLVPDESFKMRYAITAKIWFERAADSAAMAGEIQRAKMLKEKTAIFAAMVK